jgi:streptomycin 6-kinase
MGTPWQVPEDLVARMTRAPDTSQWLAGLPVLAEELAQQWALRPDGRAWSGFLSAVWPVRSESATDLVLKVGYPDPKTQWEAKALTAWAGRGTVRCVDYDAGRNGLLLERLDGDVSLEHDADIDHACEVIGSILANLHTVPVPEGIRTVAEEAAEVVDRLRSGVRGSPGLLPSRQVAGAMSTLGDLQVSDGASWLLHADCHFLNVLRTLDGSSWRGIDPLPTAGPREWELLPLLRNRWADAAATGDPDAALRRRVDLVCELIGADVARARLIAQAAAVTMLVELLPDDPGHFFVPPLQVMGCWLA